MNLSRVCDHVFDAGTYTDLDYDYIEALFAGGYDPAAPKCTCVMKKLDDGQMIAGRNMDLNITNNPAYIVRTAVPGCHRTVGLTYTFSAAAPTDAEVEANGVTDDFYRQIPFLSCDVLNDAGLYIEINMRTGEGDRFVCSGTHPGGRRVYVVMLARYIGEHCSDIAEALEYVRTLDLFTRSGGADAWNFCFMMADASGRHGLLEIARNCLIWHEGHCAQANFYVDSELFAIEEYAAGLGRYRYVTEGIGAVKNEKDMFTLMNGVSYHYIYEEECPFDRRTELVGMKPHFTAKYLLADENRDEVTAEFRRLIDKNRRLTRQEKQDEGAMWESTFTEVINCTKKTLFVRFFEDGARTMTLAV